MLLRVHGQPVTLTDGLQGLREGVCANIHSGTPSRNNVSIHCQVAGGVDLADGVHAD